MKLNLAIPMLAMRKEASHKSELVSQILFGETFDIIEEYRDWAFVCTEHDHYIAWIENKIFYFNAVANEKPSKIISSFSAEIIHQNKSIRIPFGSFYSASEKELLIGSCILKCDVEEAMHLVKAQLLGSPYLWGGRTGFGIDCSGLTQLFYRLQNISIPRDAHMQAKIGDDIFLTQVAIGDLLFYSNAENKIIHVGIAVDNKYILHASGNVRIDTYDSKGIFNDELNSYTHSFALAKRITALE